MEIKTKHHWGHRVALRVDIQRRVVYPRADFWCLAAVWCDGTPASSWRTDAGTLPTCHTCNKRALPDATFAFVPTAEVSMTSHAQYSCYLWRCRTVNSTRGKILTSSGSKYSSSSSHTYQLAKRGMAFSSKRCRARDQFPTWYQGGMPKA